MLPGLKQPVDSLIPGGPFTAEDQQPPKPRAPQSTAALGHRHSLGAAGPAPPRDARRTSLRDGLELYALLL